MENGLQFFCGLGAKLTAQLVVPGVESFSGLIFGKNDKDVIIGRSVITDGFRVGVGLGASVGPSVFLGWAKNLSTLETKQFSTNIKDAKSVMDAINGQIALPGTKLSGSKAIAQSVKQIAEFFGNTPGGAAAAKAFGNSVNVAAAWDKNRSLASSLYTAASAAFNDKGDEVFLIVDLPFVGIGAEISLSVTVCSTMTFSDPSQHSYAGVYDVFFDKWHYNYYLYPNGDAKWLDINNNMFGGGIWQNLADRKQIKWHGELGSWDEFVPRPKSETTPTGSWRNKFPNGKCKMDNKEYSTYVFWKDALPTQEASKNRATR